MQKSHRIGVADACPIFRAGLRMLLQKSDYALGLETGNPTEVMSLLKSRIVHVLILEPFTQGVGFGLRLLETLHPLFPHVRVLVCTWRSDPDLPLYALRCGAAGFITKNSGGKQLLSAVQGVLNGRPSFAPEIMEQCAYIVSGQTRLDRGRLSPREREVCELIAAGQPLVQIAKTLHLSPSTVSTIRGRILEKSSLKSDADLVRYADRLL
jgi:DNA-binding NarL/FixJ family response regulator